MRNLSRLLSRIRWFHYLLRNIDSKDKYKMILYTIVRRIHKLTGRILVEHIDITIEGKKLRMKPILSDFMFVYEIWYQNVYERLPSFLVKDGYNCLDIGASIGSVSLRWAEHNKKGSIIAVEPHPETFQRLKKNCELNNMHNIECVNAAIASESGTGSIRIKENSSLARVMGKPKEGEIQANCSMLSIDDLTRWKSIDHVDLMKIDVEGYETACLKGAKHTLEATDRIIVEYHNERLKNEVISILTENRFAVRDMCEDNLSLIYAEKIHADAL